MTFAFGIGDLALLRRSLGGPFRAGVEVVVEARIRGVTVGRRYRVCETGVSGLAAARTWAGEADLEPMMAETAKERER